jgi:hypothetical protein
MASEAPGMNLCAGHQTLSWFRLENFRFQMNEAG